MVMATATRAMAVFALPLLVLVLLDVANATTNGGSVTFCAGKDFTNCTRRVFVWQINECVGLECLDGPVASITWANLDGTPRVKGKMTVTLYGSANCFGNGTTFDTDPAQAPRDWSSGGGSRRLLSMKVSEDSAPETPSQASHPTCISAEELRVPNKFKPKPWNATVRFVQLNGTNFRTVPISASHTCYTFDCGDGLKFDGWNVVGKLPNASMLNAEQEAQIYFYSQPNCQGQRERFSAVIGEGVRSMFSDSWTTTSSLMIQQFSPYAEQQESATCGTELIPVDAVESPDKKSHLVTWLVPIICVVVVLGAVMGWFLRKRWQLWSAGSLEGAIVVDSVLLSLRLPAGDIVLGRVLGTGAHGIVYQATYCDAVVVVKKLKNTQNASDSILVDQFLNEIKLAAHLDHPNIVKLVGVVWTRLSDVGAVFEFMAGGSLSDLLYREGAAQLLDWDAPRHIVGKRSLAEDIAQALICLHGCQPPVLHRDLKSMNVLLTSALRAKLTDFGVSRSVSHQTTMTAEVGTLAWIAPEVLNGERYTEKADIYSFGVILSEIDTLRQPYQNMRTDTSTRSASMPVSKTGAKNTNGSASMANNAHIAFLVGAGQLRPDFTSKCPPAVRALAERCLAQSPDNRPSASELVDGLHGTSGLSK